MAHYDPESGYAQAIDPHPPADKSNFVEDEKGQADSKFIDDLIAANDMKSYILAAGHDIESEVIIDLNLLYSIFRSDIETRRAEFEGAMPSSTEIP